MNSPARGMVKDKWRCLFASSDKNQWDSALTEGSGELVNVKSTETQAIEKERAMRRNFKNTGQISWWRREVVNLSEHIGSLRHV